MVMVKGKNKVKTKVIPAFPSNLLPRQCSNLFEVVEVKLLKTIDVGGTFAASLLFNRAKAMLYFSIQAWLEFRMMS